VGSLLAGALIAAALAAPFSQSDHLDNATASRAAGGVRNAAIVWSSSDAIRSVNVDGSGRHVLVPQIADAVGDPTWTPDGRVFAFYGRNSDDVRIHVRWPGTHRERVLRVDYRSPPKPPRAYAYILEPTWSPDATRIAVSDSWSDQGATIRVVSLGTDKWTSVTKPRPYNAYVEDLDPAWSPDGRTIAFARRVKGGTPTLYLVHPDGSTIRRLTNGHSPSWSPDGKNIAFALGDSIYRIRADGRGRTRIVNGLVNPVVRWSPDGRKLLYTSDDHARADAWIADVDGTHRRRMLHDQPIYGITWRPALG
jgi:Tol biopolymer transport system component